MSHDKWQLIVLGLMIVVISVLLFNAPEYSVTTGYDYFKHPKYTRFINWGGTFQLIIPIVLIGGFLVLVLRKKKV